MLLARRLAGMLVDVVTYRALAVIKPPETRARFIHPPQDTEDMPPVNVCARLSGSVRFCDAEYLGPMVLNSLPLVFDKKDSGIGRKDCITVIRGICYPLNIWGQLRAGSAVNVLKRQTFDHG
jgi:hypothetical protein